MFNTIKLVIARGIPTQIFQTIVPRIAVIVAALHSLWAWANKRGQHQCVWAHNSLFVVFPKIHKGPRIINMLGISLYAPRFDGAYAAMIRNFVQTFKSNGRFPVFHKNSHGMTIGILP